MEYPASASSLSLVTSEMIVFSESACSSISLFIIVMSWLRLEIASPVIFVCFYGMEFNPAPYVVLE
jgi:hypothetical protein|tara:strand:- start:240 stop:437 length:198 start_codon:yes stop_codon:yes gene_type:complete